MCEQTIAADDAGAASIPEWDAAILQLAALQALSWAGVQAKARLLQHLSPWPPNAALINLGDPEEQLLASLLRDLLYAGDS